VVTVSVKGGRKVLMLRHMPSSLPRRSYGRISTVLDQLITFPATSRPDLLAAAVLDALTGGDSAWPGTAAGDQIRVMEIDPALADTAEFCARYGVAAEESANCVVVAARRGGNETLAACVVLATTRADLNNLVRRHLGARKVSFLPMDLAVAATGMEFGGITPVGLPVDWPLLVDSAVVRTDRVVVGSGVRRSKLVVPGRVLASLGKAEVMAGLGVPIQGG
jgi:prolyl-tRNA editing enzyme YbaK/EbsC (Cys-tRNA(Pro) deacylase)